MRPDENIENNDFENFEDQGEDRTNALEKKADRYAKIAGILLLISFIMWGSIYVIQTIVLNITKRLDVSDFIGDIMLFGGVFLYALAAFYTIKGYFIERTKRVKEKVILIFVIPVSLFVIGALLFLFVELLFGWFR